MKHDTQPQAVSCYKGKSPRYAASRLIPPKKRVLDMILIYEFSCHSGIGIYIKKDEHLSLINRKITPTTLVHYFLVVYSTSWSSCCEFPKTYHFWEYPSILNTRPEFLKGGEVCGFPSLAIVPNCEPTNKWWKLPPWANLRYKKHIPSSNWGFPQILRHIQAMFPIFQSSILSPPNP